LLGVLLRAIIEPWARQQRNDACQRFYWQGSNGKNGAIMWARRFAVKYIWLALVTVLTPVILLLVAAYLLYRRGPPSAAGEVLAGYVSIHDRTTSESVSVQSLLHSPRPGAFTPEMSSVTYGSSWYFGTTYDTQGNPGDPASRPVPYPVTDLWCATLRSPNGQPRTVLLAQHEDLYVAAWVVHEPASEAAARDLCR
jgi:hypothetical protein